MNTYISQQVHSYKMTLTLSLACWSLACEYLATIASDLCPESFFNMLRGSSIREFCYEGVTEGVEYNLHWGVVYTLV